MTARRELLVAVGLCLLGSGLILLAVSRAWVSARIPAAEPLPSRAIEVVGARLAPGSRALALVGLAGVAALPATRTWGRALVGCLVAAAGLGAGATVISALGDRSGALSDAGQATEAHFATVPSFGLWPYVAIVGAALLVAAGLLVVVRGRSWVSMSSRYDAPADVAARPVGDRSVWDALDRGEDPTGEPADTGG